MTRPGPVTPASGDELVLGVEHRIWNAMYLALRPARLSTDTRTEVARAVIAAVRPLIEAEAGNRIADAIAAAEAAQQVRWATGPEAERPSHLPRSWWEDGMETAERIARGETP